MYPRVYRVSEWPSTTANRGTWPNHIVSLRDTFEPERDAEAEICPHPRSLDLSLSVYVLLPPAFPSKDQRPRVRNKAQEYSRTGYILFFVVVVLVVFVCLLLFVGGRCLEASWGRFLHPSGRGSSPGPRKQPPQTISGIAASPLLPWEPCLPRPRFPMAQKKQHRCEEKGQSPRLREMLSYCLIADILVFVGSIFYF